MPYGEIQKRDKMLYIDHRRFPHFRIKTVIVGLFFSAILLCSLALPGRASAQGLELAGGYQHITGNQGTNGFNFGAGWYFTNKVSLVADYDTTWNTSTIGTFQATSVGLISSHAHLQNWLFGPRVFFGSGQVYNHTMRFFGEANFGVSHLGSELKQAGQSTISTSESSFAWMLGGGADIHITPHWTGRGNIDLLRTHFASAGQSRLRIGLGVSYTFGSREK
jgi:hypothetical protein